MATIKLIILITSIVYFIFLILMVLYNIRLYFITSTYVKTKACVISTSDGGRIPDFTKDDWGKEPEKQYLVFKYAYKDQTFTNFSNTALKEAIDYEYKTLPVYVNPKEPKKSWVWTDIYYRYSKMSQALVYGAFIYIIVLAALLALFGISEFFSLI